MGIFDSIKNAFGTKAGTEADITTSPSKLLENAGLDASGLQFGFGTGSITVSGEIPHENDRQKILDILATMPGINTVQDNMTVAMAVAASDAVSDEPETARRDAPPEAEEKSPDTSTYTVQPGDTLWKISKDHYGDGSRYMEIFEANSELLDSPDQIFPGQELTIPRPED